MAEHSIRNGMIAGEMFNNAAIVGVGQSAYTRHPEPGQSVHTFMRDAVLAALRDADVDAGAIDGLAVASFSLAPDTAVEELEAAYPESPRANLKTAL